MNLSSICQWSAFVSLFVAYILLLLGIFKAKNWIYLWLQLIGGLSFILVGIHTGTWSIWMFNSVWVAATLCAIISKIIGCIKKRKN
jgi:hypothetical protein